MRPGNIAFTYLRAMRHECVERGAANHVMQVQFLEEGERLVARPQGRMEAADGAGFASAVAGAGSAFAAFRRPFLAVGSSALRRFSRSHRTRTADTWSLSRADR